MSQWPCRTCQWHAQTQVPRAEENNWLVLILSDKKKRGIASHCKSSNLQDCWMLCSQRLLQIKKHLVPLSTYQDALCVKLPNPTCDHTTFRAKNQLTQNNSLRPTSPKDFQMYKKGTWKLCLGGGAKWEPYLTDRSTGLNLSPPPRRDVFLLRVMPLTLSDLSLGIPCYLKR